VYPRDNEGSGHVETRQQFSQTSCIKVGGVLHMYVDVPAYKNK